MLKRKLVLVLALLLLTNSCSQAPDISKVEDLSSSHTKGPVNWVRTWSGKIFEQAKAENKFVILDLEAIWCHWCHVMDEKTYQDKNVVSILNKNYIPVKIDQDSRPDLSNLYKKYGWPATIIFKPDGTEIVKRAGYINPEAMAKLLQAVIDDPSPERFQKTTKLVSSENAFLSESLRKKLEANFINTYDPQEGSLDIGQKFIDYDTVEYALVKAAEGNAKAREIATKTLNNALKIFDKAWGGIYQYSTHGDWDHPHYEKLAHVQGDHLRIYSQAYAIFKDEKYKNAAEELHRYIKNFLTSPDGVFYTSQDADLVQGEHSDDYFNLDDKARRKQGIPRIDKSIYAYQNALIIEGLAYLYMATGEQQYLDQALKATKWIIAKRSLDGGGFKHDADDDKKAQGPYLNDNLTMARALLMLYVATGEKSYLEKSIATVAFIAKHFKDKIGFLTIAIDNLPKGIAKPEPLVADNIAVARLMNLLHHYSGQENHTKLAEHAMKYLAADSVALSSITEPGILLADQEIANPPKHLTVVGGKKDSKARDLFKSALQFPAATYKRIEWWDPKEGKLINHDVEYPQLKKAAIFACANQRCSLPVFEAKGVAELIESMNEDQA